MTAGIRARSDGRYAVAGDLTFGTVAELHREAVSAADARFADLSGVSRVDSAGVALLLDWCREVQARGGELQFEAVPAQLEALVRVAGLGSVFGLAPDHPAPPAASEPVGFERW